MRCLNWSTIILTMDLCSRTASAAPAWGDPKDARFQAEVDQSVQHYVEMLPSGFDARKEHDLLIVLHGHGSGRWQYVREARGECAGARDVALKHGMIFISPDYRAPDSWMGPKAEADLVQLIKEARQRHKIGKLVLGGGSMGGTGVLIFSALHPDLVDGVVSHNGTANLIEYENFQESIRKSYGGTKQQVPEEYRKRSPEFFPEKFTMPIAFSTGGKDTAVPPASTLRLARKLEKTNRNVLLLHHEKGGHATNYQDTAKTYEFVIERVREAKKSNGAEGVGEETAP